ncbi:hypothetical protein KVK76_03435 [Helicobacter pylori]|nr:hypothetical protein KVK76_03435 [Helicobacter pylori]
MAVRFGVIFISDSTIDRKAKQLRSILERKKECNFIRIAKIKEQVNEEIKINPYISEGSYIIHLIDD